MEGKREGEKEELNMVALGNIEKKQVKYISGVRKKRAGVRKKVDFSTVVPRTFWFFVLYSTLFADSKKSTAFGLFIQEVFLNIF